MSAMQLKGTPVSIDTVVATKPANKGNADVDENSTPGSAKYDNTNGIAHAESSKPLRLPVARKTADASEQPASNGIAADQDAEGAGDVPTLLTRPRVGLDDCSPQPAQACGFDLVRDLQNYEAQETRQDKDIGEKGKFDDEEKPIDEETKRIEKQAKEDFDRMMAEIAEVMKKEIADIWQKYHEDVAPRLRRMDEEYERMRTKREEEWKIEAERREKEEKDFQRQQAQEWKKFYEEQAKKKVYKGPAPQEMKRSKPKDALAWLNGSQDKKRQSASDWLGPLPAK